jgi:membrane protein YqaA with SNARE-associated domain
MKTTLFTRLMTRLSRMTDSPAFPMMGFVLAFAATLVAVAFVPVLCALVSLKRQHWLRIAAYCAVGSALGATLIAWLVAQYGTQAIAEFLPGIGRSPIWESGLRWVNQYGLIALGVVAALPSSQTPVLIVCALLGIPLPGVFASVLLGKMIKYSVCAASTAATLNHHAASQPAEAFGHQFPR